MATMHQRRSNRYIILSLRICWILLKPSGAHQAQVGGCLAGVKFSPQQTNAFITNECILKSILLGV
jgi:hypothetical protein